MTNLSVIQLDQLANNIKAWAHSLGFQHVGICDIDLSQHEKALNNWIEKQYHGDMSFFERNQEKRLDPSKLHAGTVRVISVSMNYLPPDASFAKNLKASDHAYVSRYALGRDYHKVIRKKLSQLARLITENSEAQGFRPFVDSAPVLEHALAEKAGIGWTGKHSLTLNKESGSWFFLGELFINLPLPVDKPIEEACGNCTACISICPTQAIVEPYVVDARKCISYLTIENNGPIPIEYRKAIGNRIYGCDDCQLVCPWNKYATTTDEKDFFARAHIHGKTLLDFFVWDEETFLEKTAGSPIRRIGYFKWKRNLIVAMGNAQDTKGLILQAMEQAIIDLADNHSEDEHENTKILEEHLRWAISEHKSRKNLGANRQTLRLARSVERGTPDHA